MYMYVRIFDSCIAFFPSLVEEHAHNVRQPYKHIGTSTTTTTCRFIFFVCVSFPSERHVRAQNEAQHAKVQKRETRAEGEQEQCLGHEWSQ